MAGGIIGFISHKSKIQCIRFFMVKCYAEVGNVNDIPQRAVNRAVELIEVKGRVDRVGNLEKGVGDLFHLTDGRFPGIIARLIMPVVWCSQFQSVIQRDAQSFYFRSVKKPF